MTQIPWLSICSSTNNNFPRLTFPKDQRKMIIAAVVFAFAQASAPSTPTLDQSVTCHQPVRLYQEWVITEFGMEEAVKMDPLARRSSIQRCGLETLKGCREEKLALA